jgi:RNA polymerase sigma factor (sigma-70 family)
MMGRSVVRPTPTAEDAMPAILARSFVSLTRLLTARREADAALLARYASANDPTAFAELVHRHGPMVLGVCRRMLGHVHDADDAFQATFLAFARSARSVRKPDALSAWLYGTAVRVCRKARSSRAAPRPLPAQAAAGDDPYAEVAWKEVRGLLDDEVGRLPDSLRAPLLLCYFNGLSRDEAAEKLGWSRRTLMRRLEQARQRLRWRLERRGVATLGLGVAVLSPSELIASVPASLLTAAVGVGTGGTVPASVQALVGGAAGKLLPKAALALLLAAGGLGLAALPSPVTGPSASSSPLAASAVDRNPLPQGKGPRLDADGRPLPAGALHRLGSRRFRLEGWNSFLLPTPDGKHLLTQPHPRLSSYPAQGLMLLDADTGLRLLAFEDSWRVPKLTGTDDMRPAAFSPDGTTLYAVANRKDHQKDWWGSDQLPCERSLLVWNAATGKVKAEWPLPSGWGASLLAVNVTTDGKRVFVYGRIGFQVLGVHVLDAGSGKLLSTWPNTGYLVGMTAGGKELVTHRTKGGAITAHDAQTGQLLRTFPLAGTVRSVALSPDRKTVAAVGIAGEGNQQTCEIKLWEAATGREIRRLTVDPRRIRYEPARLVFAADGKTLYLGTMSGRILRWDLSNGTALPDWPVHRGMVMDLFLRPGKNELVSVGWGDGAIRRWDAATGKALTITDAYVGLLAVARTPDGKEVALGDMAGRLDVWDLGTGRVTRTLHLPAARERDLTFSPDGRWLLDATEDGQIKVREAVTGKVVREIPAAGPGCWGLTFSPDGRRLFASRHNETRLLTWPDGTVVWQQGATCIGALSPDGGRIVSGNWNDKTVLRDPQSGAVLSELPGGDLTSAAFSPDGQRLATAHLWGVWRVRDGVTGAVRKEMKGFAHVWDVAFSPSGWLLAVAGDNSVRVYDTASWLEVARFDGHEGTVRTVFFGPDEATLVSVSAEDGTALVWSLRPSAGREQPDPARLWADLSGDGPAIRQAVWAVAQHPDVAVELFRQKWPVPQHPVDAARVRRLIGGLDSETFAEREAAEADLAKLGRPAEAELRKALAGTPSAEVRRRVGRILARWGPPATAEYPAGEARELRAVWALELAGTPEAKKLLESWAAAKVGNRLCEEAIAALKRIQRSNR